MKMSCFVTNGTIATIEFLHSIRRSREFVRRKMRDSEEEDVAD